MQHFIEYVQHNKESDPIAIEDFKIFRNRNGNWCYSFSSPSHKYLNTGCEGEGDCIGNEQLDHWCKFLTFETQEVFPVLNFGELAYCNDGEVKVWLIPDSEEEEKQIDNVAYCVLPKRWGYNVLLVPAEDFEPV